MSETMRPATIETILCEALELKGKRIIDVGSGDGAFTRFMTRGGASVIGLECGAAQLQKAQSVALAGAERYVDGVAQAMPFADASADIVVFVNSLHHIPLAVQGQALEEAARVLSADGCLLVIEPLAEGPMYELLRPVDDEREVRAAAYGALRAAKGFRSLWERFYVMVRSITGFDAIREGTIRVDPARAPRFAALDAELRIQFERLATKLPQGGYEIRQPLRANLLQRAA